MTPLGAGMLLAGLVAIAALGVVLWAFSQKAQANERRLRVLLSALPDVVLRVGADGRIREHLSGDGGLLGITGPLAGVPLVDRLPADAAAEVRSGLADPPAQVELDGGGRDVIVSLQALRGDELLLVARDVTQERVAARSKDEFVSMVSHELRTPLTAIRGGLELVSKGVMGELPESAQELVDTAVRNTHRLHRLIDDLLDAQKIESGRLDFSFQRLSVGEILDTAVELNRGYGQAMSVDVVVGDACPEGEVQADPDRLQQVLANLLSNAFKHSPQGGTVRMRAWNNDGHVRIEVRDEGEGIPEEFRAHLFERFRQADAALTRSVGGSGLGLAIAKAIVEKCGGIIGFDSAPGEGACFWFELPLLQVRKTTGRMQGVVLTDRLR